jgi:hypothetical protein
VTVSSVRDTISETTGRRMHVEKQGDTTYVPYTSGAELVIEKTGDAVVSQSGRPLMREVRTITKAKAPRKGFVMDYPPGEYERIFRKGST